MALRKPLAQRDGRIEARGDRELARILTRAFTLAGERDPDTLTHGFHAYPARMHPAIARVLLEELAVPRARVLDPFCGSGTVLVEALVHGHRSAGIDLNPVALRVAEVKCTIRDAASSKRFGETLRSVAIASEERVRGRIDARAPVSRAEASFYQPHVLKELAGLWKEIEAVPDEADRRVLEVVLSAILVKFSRQRADTAEGLVDKRLRKGLVTEFFHRKGRELVARWRELRAALRGEPSLPRFIEGDARDLPRLLPSRVQADLVISSPPYGGTYDYHTQHARRYAWLNVRSDKLAKLEMGARRNLGDRDEALQRWDDEVRAALRAIARVLSKKANVVLLMGDAQLGRARVPADEQLERLAPKVGLDVVSVASQKRIDWTGRAARKEHLVALVPRPNQRK